MKISVNIGLIRAPMEEIKDEFQVIDQYRNGNNIELPILIDQKSKDLLSYHDKIMVEAIGWGYFKKLAIRNTPVSYGSC